MWAMEVTACAAAVVNSKCNYNVTMYVNYENEKVAVFWHLTYTVSVRWGGGIPPPLHLHYLL